MSARFVLVAAALAAASCGLKTAPIAPELVVPTPPTNLRATPTPDGVHLVWRRPTRYTGGGRMRDVQRFDIERAVGDARTYTPHGSVVMADQYQLRQPRRIEWTDTDAAPGLRYRYRVIAVTSDAQHSVPSDPATIEHRVVTPSADDES